jgi:hypothetical protein
MSMHRAHGLLALLLLGGGGCSGKTSNTSADESSARIISGLVTLRPGESVQIDGATRLTLVGVPEDSRCHPTVVCIWAGEAKVQLSTINKSGATDSLTITIPKEPSGGVIAGHKVEVVDLNFLALEDTVSAHYRVRLRIQ